MELTDMTNGIGYLHVMYPAPTTDEILLTRAEAYAMKGEYDKALADLNIWGLSMNPPLTLHQRHQYLLRYSGPRLQR